MTWKKLKVNQFTRMIWYVWLYFHGDIYTARITTLLCLLLTVLEKDRIRCKQS